MRNEPHGFTPKTEGPFSVWLSDADREDIRAAAHLTRTRPSAFVREAALERARAIIAPGSVSVRFLTPSVEDAE